MEILLVLAGFCVLCLSGCIGTLIVSQRLINRAFDIVNFVVSYLEQHRPELDINRPEVSD